MDKKPVTIITGYLGAGKTTLINRLLRSERNRRTALIVNDIGSVNIDADLIRSESCVKQNVVELTNGCICCTLQDEFMTQIEELSKDDRIDRILVEASGVSDSANIAMGFMSYEEVTLNTRVYLDSIVTVADAYRIYDEFYEEIIDKQEQDESPDILNLIMDQIEFCNVVILNKCDLLKEEEVEKVENLVRSFQKNAKLLHSVKGELNPDEIFENEPFDFDRVMHSSSIQAALQRDEHMDANMDSDYGISSFVYEDMRPFDQDKFMDLLENNYPGGIIRTKGYIWFADDDIHMYLFEQTGHNGSVTVFSNWVSALPEKDKEEFLKNYPGEDAEWDPFYGDRVNQIVFIGKDFDPDDVKERLESCLAEEWNERKIK